MRQDIDKAREMQGNEQQVLQANENGGKWDGAMRIFQALSSVDETLLERSEGGENGQKKIIPFYRYTKVMAACICFVVLGAVAFTATRMAVNDKFTSSDCAAEAVMEEAAVEEAVMEDAAMEEVVTEGAAVEVAEEETVIEGAAVEEAAVEDLEEYKEEENTSDMTIADAAGTESVASQSESKNQDTLVWDSGPKDTGIEELDEDGVRTMEVLGDYIPTEIPSGYVFAYGSRDNGAEGPGSVSINWSKGMDGIHISVIEYLVEDERGNRMVDISEPETYDVSLYEIPYAETVPDEYRQIFNNPIFKESDFTLDIVKARMKSFDDAGDTDTPRGKFSVLYDSGVVVSFSGEANPEDVWTMFQSIAE